MRFFLCYKTNLRAQGPGRSEKAIPRIRPPLVALASIEPSFRSSFSSDKMAERKSLLNPDAAPYVPVCKFLYGTGDKVTEAEVGLPGTDTAVENSIEHQLPDTLDYDTKSFEKLNLSGASSSKTDQYDNLDEILQDEIDEWDAKVDHLSSVFPDISVEYLAELLIVNGGDLEETVFVLQQFEGAGDGFEDPVQAAVASDVSGIASEEASSSGTKD
ncbi:hypothetical protein OPV22_021132 [Ensete ventricosum]|uniref:CUE domain-containing protein n=1 Tax=Ensete ventricosum TaxID=4639 RepID=A0AAV8QI27_ENSVE|nr:hypothetical protein OPV22_021132 [Ensete ventricosum]